MTPTEKQAILSENLDFSISQLNNVLKGKGLDEIRQALIDLNSKHTLPYWFDQLQKDQSFPNLDGKTIGSIVEMLYVSVLQTYVFNKGEIKLSLNPAKGIDIPELELGIKSPSTNFCTSEPFFSSYERILGNTYDVLILLTNYQEAKKASKLKVQISNWKYLRGSQVADSYLCEIARTHRDWLLKENPVELKKLYCFLAHVVKSEWLAKKILNLIEVMNDEEKILKAINLAEQDFEKKNLDAIKKGKEIINPEDLQIIKNISTNKPMYINIINAANNWGITYHKEFYRPPNENEWDRFLHSPLDGQVGISFALQWRYNFRPLFPKTSKRESKRK